MKRTINSGYELRNECIDFDRDYYSPEAYDVMLNFYDEMIDPDMELDVIGICGEFTEYDDARELADAYDHLYTLDDWKDDNDIGLYDEEDDDFIDWMNESFIDALIEKINEVAQVFLLDSGGYLVYE